MKEKTAFFKNLKYLSKRIPKLLLITWLLFKIWRDMIYILSWEHPLTKLSWMFIMMKIKWIDGKTHVSENKLNLKKKFLS